jgi:large-conductance mechanosensitive channel
MNKIITAVVIGAAIGAVIGEFFPDIFSSGLHASLGASLSQPFSPYRNHLTIRYLVFGGLLGAAAGFVLEQIRGKRK